MTTEDDEIKIPCPSSDEMTKIYFLRLYHSCYRCQIKHNLVPKTDREYLWYLYYGKNETLQCIVCGKNISHSGWHKCHILSKKMGGGNEMSNLAAGCVSCNTSMREKFFHDYMREKGLKERAYFFPMDAKSY